jgi:hypothetical protein
VYQSSLTRRRFGILAGGLAGGAAVSACGTSRSVRTARPATPLNNLLHDAAGTVTMFPSPASVTASPKTTISLRGTSAVDATGITITGSRSGRHTGRVRAHPDGGGASFVPDKPFTAGETVVVTSGLAIRGRSGDAAHFTVSRPAVETTPPSATASATPTPAVSTYLSEPDVQAPRITVTTNTAGTAPGYVLYAAKGGGLPAELILSRSDGTMVWQRTIAKNVSANALQVQQWRGAPVLTWWQGTQNAHGYGLGENMVVDEAYRTIATVRAGNGYSADLHEFQLTSAGTALVTIYSPIRWDLRPYGGKDEAIALDSIVQEVDVATGLVLFEWHALDHLSPADSYVSAPSNTTTSWDFFHVNSIDVGADNTLLISARHFSSLTNLDRATGDVLWTLGGKSGSVSLQGTPFFFQHDARWQSDGTITLFDDGGGPPRHEKQARVLRLKPDLATKKATTVSSLTHPTAIITNSQGNAETLSNGNVFVGWGDQPNMTEFSSSGRVVWDAVLPSGVTTYRAYRVRWDGRPTTAPKAALVDRGGKRSVYISWNGDTRTATWRLLGTTSAGAAPKVLAHAAAATFEVSMTVPAKARQLRVQALDASGHILATVSVR